MRRRPCSKTSPSTSIGAPAASSRSPPRWRGATRSSTGHRVAAERRPVLGGARPIPRLVRTPEDTLAAYDRVIHDESVSEAAGVEYACLLLLNEKAPAYRSWCERRSGSTGPDSAGVMLARAGALVPGTFADPSRLVRWAEPAVAKGPHSSTSLHVLGLAELRAGRSDRALRQFRESIRNGGDAIPNWYGLALALAAGRATKARGWLAKADDWMDRTTATFADKAAHPKPPVPIADWLKAQVLQREARSLWARAGWATSRPTAGPSTPGRPSA